MLKFEYVLIVVLFHLEAGLLGRQPRFGRPLLRHEGGPAGRLRYLDACQPGFLEHGGRIFWNPIYWRRERGRKRVGEREGEIKGERGEKEEKREKEEGERERERRIQKRTKWFPYEKIQTENYRSLLVFLVFTYFLFISAKTRNGTKL